jgi:hypothetical protein
VQGRGLRRGRRRRREDDGCGESANPGPRTHGITPRDSRAAAGRRG